MAIKINDFDIFLTVGDLVQAPETSLLSSFPLPQRGKLGRIAQSQIQKTRPNQTGLFHSEFPVKHNFNLKPYTINVNGKIDGLFRFKNHIEIEEIKTVLLSAGDFKKVSPELYPHYCEQVYFYAYLLQNELGNKQVIPFLIIHNLINNKQKLFKLNFNFKNTEQKILERLKLLINNIEHQKQEQNYRKKLIEKITFPFAHVHPQQEKLLSKIENSIENKEHLLVSAPTGTGKTISALYPAIHYAYLNNKKIFFATSRNTQQQAVLETIQSIVRQGLSLKIMAMSSARRMCLNDIFFCHEAWCPYAKDYRKRFLQEINPERFFENHILASNELLQFGKEKKLCPAEMQHDAGLMCDIIVGDYNYLFDPAVQLRRIFQKTDFDDWIIILDEAHNLYERGRSYLSPYIKKNDLIILKETLKSYKTKVYKDLSGSLKGIADLLEKLQQDGEINYSNQQYFETQLNKNLWIDRFQQFESAFISYLIYKIKKTILVPDDPVEKTYYQLRRFIQTLKNLDDSFTVYYDAADNGVLKILNCDPSTYLGNIIDSFHSVVAMSATLDPINYYKDVLGFPDYRTDLMEMDSPFSSSKRKVIIIPDIDTRYKKRNENYQKIAQIINKSTRLKNVNYIVFFPGFNFLQNVNLFLDRPEKKILQKPSMQTSERDDILEIMKTDKGYLLLAVMGGIFSEGIDFKGDMVNGIFIVSPGLPQVNYEREIINRYYEQKKSMGTEYAYLYPGMNKVIQAAGRLIRSYTDYGFVMLIGKRFAEESFNQLLPEYWFESKENVVITEDYMTELKSFWDSTTEQD